MYLELFCGRARLCYYNQTKHFNEEVFWVSSSGLVAGTANHSMSIEEMKNNFKSPGQFREKMGVLCGAAAHVAT